MIIGGTYVASFNRQIIVSETFVVPFGGNVDIVSKDFGFDLRLHIHFLPLGRLRLSPKYSIRVEADGIHFDFADWLNAALPEPADFVDLGTAEGDLRLSFIIASQRVGEMNLVHFEVLRPR